jgi:hypothetical protein
MTHRFVRVDVQVRRLKESGTGSVRAEDCVVEGREALFVAEKDGSVLGWGAEETGVDGCEGGLVGEVRVGLEGVVVHVVVVVEELVHWCRHRSWCE